jgi:LAGLIDADG DNA endonuclease family protein
MTSVISKDKFFQEIGYVPHPKQKLYHDSEARFRIASCGRRFGKMEWVENLIPLASGGFRRMGDIQVGDEVLGPDGRPTAVTYVTDVINDLNCYRVTFNDNNSIVVGADHLWETWDKSARRSVRVHDDSHATDRRRLERKPSVRTTEEIRRTLKYGAKQENNHAIEIAAPIQYPTRPLWLDPYVLGVWLGDGSSLNGEMTSHIDDVDIRIEIERAGYEVRKLKATNQYNVCGLITELRLIGVLGNKHVPNDYLFGSVEQRLSLLQGLMDTDGTVGKNGQCCFDNTNKNLADAVYHLLVSLGAKATRYTRQGKLYGVDKKVVYRVNFMSPWLDVFRLGRKLERQKYNHTASAQVYRFIKAVDPVPSVPCRCIKVDREDGLYLTSEHYIVTHNTVSAARDMEPELFLPNRRYWIVGPQYSLAEKEFRVVWDDLIIGQQLGKNKQVKRAYNVKQGDMYIELPWRTRLEVRSASHPESLVGEGLHGVIMSEAAKHSEDTWERYIRPALSDYRGWASFCSTPEGMNFFHKLWQLGHNPDHPQYESWRFPSWENRILYPGGRQDPEILMMEKTTSKEWFDQEIGADFTAFVGRVFCYDDKTEILTDDGFKNVLEVTAGENVATLASNGEMTFAPCSKAFSFHHTGDMLEHNGRALDFCVTPNHKMWCKRYSSPHHVHYADREYEFVQADSMKSPTLHKRTSDSWVGNGPDRIVFENDKYGWYATKRREFDVGDWCEFVGWWLSEGSIQSPYRVCISQDTGENADRISALLTRMGLAYTYQPDKYRFTVTSWPIVRYLLQNARSGNCAEDKCRSNQLSYSCCSHNKKIPRELLAYSEKSLSRLYMGMTLGDGHDTWYNLTSDTKYGGGNRYCTTSRQLADDMQELCLRIGKVANVLGPYENDTGTRYFIVGIYRDGWTEAVVKRPNIKRVEYDGLVGCVTVEPHHTVFVRRNGKGFWCGNSEFQESTHVRKHVFNPDWVNVMVWDWGFINPLACIEFQIDPWDNIHVWREHYGAFKTLEQHIFEISTREQPPGYKIDMSFGDAADPEAAIYVTQHYTTCWTDPAAKTNWREGIELMKTFLKDYETSETDEYGTPVMCPKFFVDHSCINTIREFNNYKAKEAPRNSRNKSNPRDEAQNYDNHTLDCIRYGLMHLYKLGASSHLVDTMPSLTGVSTGSSTIFNSKNLEF